MAVDGKMVDKPVLLRAEAILEPLLRRHGVTQLLHAPRAEGDALFEASDRKSLADAQRRGVIPLVTFVKQAIWRTPAGGTTCAAVAAAEDVLCATWAAS